LKSISCDRAASAALTQLLRSQSGLITRSRLAATTQQNALSDFTLTLGTIQAFIIIAMTTSLAVLVGW